MFMLPLRPGVVQGLFDVVCMLCLRRGAVKVKEAKWSAHRIMPKSAQYNCAGIGDLQWSAVGTCFQSEGLPVKSQSLGHKITC